MSSCRLCEEPAIILPQHKITVHAVCTSSPPDEHVCAAVCGGHAAKGLLAAPSLWKYVGAVWEPTLWATELNITLIQIHMWARQVRLRVTTSESESTVHCGSSCGVGQ